MLGSVHWHVAAHHNELGGTAYLSERYGADTRQPNAHLSKPLTQRRYEDNKTSATTHTAILFHLFMFDFFMQFTYHFREAQTQIVWSSTVYCSFFSQVLWLDSDQSQFLSTPSRNHHFQHHHTTTSHLLSRSDKYHQVGVVRYMYGNMLARQAKFLHTLVLPVVDVDRQLYLLGKQNWFDNVIDSSEAQPIFRQVITIITQFGY